MPRNIPVVHNLGIRLSEKPEYIDVMLKTTTVLIGNRVEMSHLQEVTNLTPETMFAFSSSLQYIVITAPDGTGFNCFVAVTLSSCLILAKRWNRSVLLSELETHLLSAFCGA